LYSIVSDNPKNELITIPVIARVTIVFIKKIKNNFLLIVKDSIFILTHCWLVLVSKNISVSFNYNGFKNSPKHFEKI